MTDVTASEVHVERVENGWIVSIPCTSWRYVFQTGEEMCNFLASVMRRENA